MSEKSIDTLEDLPAVAFGVGVAATLLVSGLILRATHGDLAAVALAAAILWLAASLDQGGSRLEVFLFGLAVGVGGWCSLPLLFCSTLACAWVLLRWPAALRRRAALGVVLLGFLLGTLLGTRVARPSSSLQTGLASQLSDAADALWDSEPGD